MLFSTKTPLEKIFSDGFSKSAFPISARLSDDYAIDAIVRTVRKEFSTLTMPQYNGEAEALFLRPITRWAAMAVQADYTPGTITRLAAAMSAQAIIIAKLMQSMNYKDIGNNLAATVIQDQPTFKMLAAQFAPNESSDKDIKGVWQKISQYLNSIDKSDEDEDILTKLFTVLSPDDSVLHIQDDTSELFTTIATYLGWGKGVPMKLVVPDDSESLSFQSRVNQINEILHAIGVLQEQALMDDPSAYLSDIIVLAFGLLSWRHMTATDAEYDLQFQQHVMPSNTALYAAEIGNVAKKIAQHYKELARAGATLDIHATLLAWKELRAYINEAIPNTSEVRDMDEKIKSEIEEPLSHLTPPLMAELANMAIEDYKRYTQADYLIRSNWVPAIKLMLEKAPVKKSSVIPDKIALLTAANAVLVDDQNIPIKLFEHRSTIVFGLSKLAATMVDAVQAIGRLEVLLTADAQLQQSYQVDAVETPEFPGKIDDVPYLSFRKPLPRQSVIPPFSPAEEGADAASAGETLYDWTLKSALFEPVYRYPFQMEHKQEDAVFFWEYTDTIQVGEPASLKYFSQPVPYCYVRSRSLSRVPFTRAGFEITIRGLLDGQYRSEDYFRDAAHIILRGGPRMQQSIVNALSGNFLIYIIDRSDATVVNSVLGDGLGQVLEPSIPWCYGASWAQVQQINQTAYNATRSKGGVIESWWSEAIIASDLAKTVLFVPIKYYPSPERTIPALYVVTTGSAIATNYSFYAYGNGPAFGTIDARGDFHPSNYAVVPMIAAAEVPMEVDKKTGEPNTDYWKRADGYTMFRLTMPHLMVEGWQPGINGLDSSLSTDDEFAAVTIRILKKYRPDIKRYDLGAFVNDEIVMWDIKDYYSFLQSYRTDIPALDAQAAAYQERSYEGREQSVDHQDNARSESLGQAINPEDQAKSIAQVTGGLTSDQANRAVQGEHSDDSSVFQGEPGVAVTSDASTSENDALAAETTTDATGKTSEGSDKLEQEKKKNKKRSRGEQSEDQEIETDDKD